MRGTLVLGLLLTVTLNACGAVGASQSPLPATAAPTLSPAATASRTATAPLLTTATSTLTIALTPIVSPSPIATYAILRGKVNVERASCRYGPGAMYLFLYGLRQGATQDVVGRTDTGAWLLTQSHGDLTRCWVKASLLDLDGDALTIEPVYPDQYTLPVSPYHLPPYTATATRSGDRVPISWTAQSLRAGDRESDTSPLFVVETWVCQDGQLVFTPIGSDVQIATVTDEPGCAERSHGRVYLAEKHGYAGPTEIPWPQP